MTPDHSVIPPEDRCECGVYRKTECERRCARDEWQARMKARAPLEDRG